MAFTAKQKVVVFNQTRQSFLSFGVTVAETHVARLVGLLGKTKLRDDDGLWMIPCQGIHTIGLLFPIDVVYLDESQRVIHTIEHLGPFRMAPIRMESHSVLELPPRTIYASQTKVTDQFLICSDQEIETNWKGMQDGELEERSGGRWKMRIADIFALVRRKRKNGASAGRVVSPLVVHFWTGGAPRAHEVRRVTAKGAYVVTADRWYPGTVVRMSFGYGQAAAKPPGVETSGVSMRGKVVGSDANGLFVEFVYLAPEERNTFSRFLETAPVEATR